LLVLVLGVWGGLIPFIGPYFHYSFGGDQTWHFTMQRLWLCILPGGVAVIGGLMLMRASSRVGGLTAGWVALVAGAWFAVGPAVALLWDHTIYAIGAPNGGQARRMLEWVGYFSGLGVAIVGLAAFAMGRFFSRPRLVEEPAVVAADVAAAEGPARHEPVTRAAVADAPAERTVVRDVPAERTAVADAPAERDVVADRPAGRTAVTDAPVDRGAVADTPATEGRGAVADSPATEARGADAPATDTRVGDAPATTVSPAATPPARRRSGGLLGRFRS
jgi:hypothetical protein